MERVALDTIPEVAKEGEREEDVEVAEARQEEERQEEDVEVAEAR